MKSQVKRSRCCSCLASSSCARFSPTRSMPASARAGRSSTSTYLMAAQISTSGPMRSRTRSRLAATRSGSIAYHQPRLATGDASIAAMREVQIRPAARAVVEVLHLRDPGRGELARYHGAQVELEAGRYALQVRERLEHLGTDLVAAPAYARPDRGLRLTLEALDGPLEDAAGQRAPAAVQHRDLGAVGQRDRVAIRDQHEQGKVRLYGEMAVDLRQQPAAGLRV